LSLVIVSYRQVGTVLKKAKVVAIGYPGYTSRAADARAMPHQLF